MDCHFESIHDDVDEPLIFSEYNEKPINKLYEHRLEMMTRELQQLQLVSRAWRDMIRPLTFRHPAINIQSGAPAQLQDYFRHLIASDHAETPASSWTRYIWLRDSSDRNLYTPGTCHNDPSAVFDEAIQALVAHQTCLQEVFSHIVLRPAVFASIADHHGSFLKRLMVRTGKADLSEICQPLARFRALTHLSVQCVWAGDGAHIPSVGFDWSFPKLNSLTLGDLLLLEVMKDSLLRSGINEKCSTVV